MKRPRRGPGRGRGGRPSYGCHFLSLIARLTRKIIATGPGAREAGIKPFQTRLRNGRPNKFILFSFRTGGGHLILCFRGNVSGGCFRPRYIARQFQNCLSRGKICCPFEFSFRDARAPRQIPTTTQMYPGWTLSYRVFGRRADIPPAVYVLAPSAPHATRTPLFAFTSTWL
ncbi:hypothetical protein EVAR_39448_1 [Eumeta japonica]|uniref:Uncharacterized protein n=1 Tax=Eumeta variegata TaxID=151549 RepID=A0A4C1W0Q7_EUMVA|nr:hypothetical protein EVAR_39448_1 [Eumeta japonica]